MHRPVANIKMYPKEISYNDSGWSELCQDRLQWRSLVNNVMNLQVQ
jgi:hypothetical protein